MKKVIFLILLIPIIAQAAGIQVSPSRLEIISQQGKPASATLTVANPTADVQLFEIYSDAFSELLTFQPASFTLEAGGKKEIRVLVQARRDTDLGTFTTDLSVISRPLRQSTVTTNTGVKIPLTVVTSDKPAFSLPTWIFYIYVAVAIAAFYAFEHWHFRKKAD